LLMQFYCWLYCVLIDQIACPANRRTTRFGNPFIHFVANASNQQSESSNQK